MLELTRADLSTYYGLLDVKDDNEDYEEDIQLLMKEVQETMEELPEYSDERQLLSTLLLKVRGFIAKVSQLIGLFMELLPCCFCFCCHVNQTLDPTPQTWRCTALPIPQQHFPPTFRQQHTPSMSSLCRLGLPFEPNIQSLKVG